MGRGAALGPDQPAVGLRGSKALVDQVLKSFERLRPSDGWSCEGGAAVLSDMLDRAGIDNRLRIGLYAPGTDDEEHHHWVELGPFEEGHTLLDPNGELRGERRLQAITVDVRRRYQPRDDIGRRGDRELMSLSPLWDWDEEDIMEVQELGKDHDPGVAVYLATLR